MIKTTAIPAAALEKTVLSVTTNPTISPFQNKEEKLRRGIFLSFPNLTLQ